MVTLSSPCRAKDPATCDYHGYEVRAAAYVKMGLYDDALAELTTRGRVGIQPEAVDEFIQASQTPANRIGTHTSHCCNIHGCKYGDIDCPVQIGHAAQEYACEQCDWNTQEYENKYGKLKTFYKQLTAIHPDNCGCLTCAAGTTAPESTWRDNAHAGDIKNALWQRASNNTGKTLTALLEDSPFTHKSATQFQAIIKGDDVDDEFENDTWGK